jgi:membrane protein
MEAGPPLEVPTDLRLDEVRLALRRTAGAFGLKDLPGSAAGVAFKIFLALFPSIVATAALYGLARTPAEIVLRVDQLARFLPPQAAELVRDNLLTMSLAEPSTAGSLAAAGIILGLVTATGAAASLILALDRSWEAPERRPFLVRRLVGLALTLALVAALAGLVLLVIGGGALQRLLLPDRLEVPLVEVPLAIGRHVLALGVLITLFAFVYWVGPNRERPRWEWLSPGSVLGVIGWIAAASAFRFYAETLGAATYERVSYGTLGGVIVLLLWLQISMLAMLLGAELNAQLERIRIERAAGRARVLGPGALSERELPEEPRSREQVFRTAVDEEH